MTTETLSPNQILIQTLKANKPLSITHGKYQPVFQALARRHSEAQAARDQHDNFYRSYAHSGWRERQIELVSRVPEAKSFGEVCCWTGPHDDPATAAKSIFAQWEASPDHWVMVNGRYDYWGYSMVQGRSGVWYATGIVGLKR